MNGFEFHCQPAFHSPDTFEPEGQQACVVINLCIVATAQQAPPVNLQNV